MAKLIKGDSVQNIITDGDVIVTSPSKIGKTLNEVLNDQQSDIDRLKSNVKYIYAYGGVGGSGSGGSGTVEKPINVFIELNGKEICKNGDDAVVLDGKGNYTLKIKISNAGEKTYYMGYSTIGSVDDKDIKYELKGDNRYKIDVNLSLNENGTLNIKIIDSEDNLIGYYYQNYIVEPDIFNVTLNYTDIRGNIQSLSKPYECFVKDQFRFNRHFKIDYSIFLLNYTDVKVECYIDGGATLNYDNDSDSIEISLENDENCGVLINGESILQDKYHGTYTLKAILSYKISGEIIRREKSITFSVVPSSLYVNVRTNADVLYDDLELLQNDILNGVHRYISQGSSLMMYCKVFEGSKEGDGNTYNITFTAYNANIDENGNIDRWESIGVEVTDYLKEQVESVKGASLTFSTEGIKKIVISTSGMKTDVGVPKYFVKYLYVKKFDNKCDWFNDKRYKCVGDSYFKANQGDNSYSKDEFGNYTFPQFSSGNGLLSLTKSSDIITIDQSNLYSDDSLLCTVITFGIQISNINSENAKIVDIYSPSSTTPVYSLKLNSLFSDDGSNKIAIPTEVLNKNDNSKYHLVQIIRNLSNIENGVSPIFEDSLYIDGLLESSDVSTVSFPSKVSKILLQNINACYNLINIQYFSYENNNGDKFNPDAYAYQYWLAYKEKYVNSDSSENRLTDGELFFINANNMDRISFDGTNVVVDPSIIMDIAQISDLPTVVFSYNCESGDKKEISEFMEDMWMGRTNGDSTFKSREIKLYWIPERSVGSIEDFEVTIPELTDYKINEDGSANPITANWEIDLQGTSTMRNRIKNYSLRINSNSTGGGNERVLFSPKFNIDFDPEKEQSFLPDVEWTIKADIADSAHANNTSIGKFVNKVCSKVDTKIPGITEDAKKFIKNTLEGIPVLLYFMCEGLDNGNQSIKTYYFGIYNFNLGRNSYYNLGYNGGIADEKNNTSDFMRVFNNIKNNVKGKYAQGKVFSFAVGECKLSQDITIGEIQENSPQFDFHQFQKSLLFKDEGSTNNNCMFGSRNKVTTSNYNNSQFALIDLVKSVAKAGKFCFQESGRKNDFVTSRYFRIDENDNTIFDHDEVCLNRYLEEKIPDPRYQITYDNNGRMVWEENSECDNVNIADLKKLIIEYDLPNGDTNVPLLDYTSASEYYTICMAFGMVDSVLKNMNLKNFSKLDDGSKFYCAFYDMDCALEENNAGLEGITYLAATDYWYSPIDSNNKVGLVEKKNDYWNSAVGSGFDFTSSYLFAVVKYAKSIFENLPEGEEKFNTQLSNFPQNFWAKLRKYDGELQSADYFMENYFKSGITTTFEYLASLNYRVKYLYRGKSFDSDGAYTEKYLANSGSFNGSRKIKAKNWLKKRLRFLDVMMNVNCLSIPISESSMLKIPSPNDFKNDLMKNPDVTILHSAFNSDNSNKSQSTFEGEVSIYAPAYTPFIFSRGTSMADMYLLPGGVDRPNKLYLTTSEAENTYFYGSGLFTSIDKIESTFTEYNSIISDNLESFEYGGTSIRGNKGSGFLINAKSIREINLNIPKMGGELKIHEDCISVEKINIAGSEFNGEFTSFPNLKEVNISGVKTASDKGITIANSDYLMGEKFYISGKDKENKTTLGFLNITGKLTGKFNCENTNIEKISIENTIKKEDIEFSLKNIEEFSIYGDSKLRELSIKGFRKVSIISCNNLEMLSIDDALEELYINLGKTEEGEMRSSLKTISLGDKIIIGDKGVIYDDDGEVLYSEREGVGVFDFTNYQNLKKVTLINCDRLFHVKLPGSKDKCVVIETDGMSNNPNLQYIDTGIIPSFFDVDNFPPTNDGLVHEYPIYQFGSKLKLCREGVFQNCPNYNMIRSDWDKASEYMEGNYGEIAYTNITVSDSCTSLANTFSMSGTPTNSNSKDIQRFNIDTVNRFLQKCVPDDIKEKITSLSGCFRGRADVKYSQRNAEYDEENNDKYSPNLEKYISLTDISYMYQNTGVSFISKWLLSLPNKYNVQNNTLSWDTFVSNMNSGINISKDALENISYRLESNSYSNIKFNIYEYNIDNNKFEIAGSEDKMLDICEFFYHKKDSKGNIIPFDNITSISSLNFGTQYIDFRGMFNLFPNVKYISNFLNGNLKTYNIDGLLKPCKNIKSIKNSFCDNDIDNDIENPQIIDLYEFFNWEDNNKEGVTNLFEGQITNGFSNGFKLRKTITYEHLKKVISSIEDIAEKNKDFIRLTNIFSYCTITNYQGEEIKFNKPLKNITNISFLFEKCTSDLKPFVNEDDDSGGKGIYRGGVLNIGRSFFENLPEFNVAQRTFANTYLSSPLTYDYFCKRGKFNEKNIFLLSDNEYTEAHLFECGYNQNIINLKECFYNTKFVNCKNWFDESDKDNKIIERNYILSNGEKIDSFGFEYYKYNSTSNSYEKYILDNDIFDDCLDNYTDYVPRNEIIIGEKPFVFYNHDLLQDFYYYGNTKNYNPPFDPKNDGLNYTIQKTYCCLPPDFLYGCSSTATIDGIFANSNITGVIPRNLTKKIKSQHIPNIFKNVNIMPNLEYYYDKDGGLNASILDKVEIDGELIGDMSDYTVVFRNEFGKLQKRKPCDGDRNLGQFVYVPANFTSSGNLMETFNFRYNLPKNWSMPDSAVDYKSTVEFNKAIEESNLELKYYTQYYFTTDKSANWDIVYNAKNVFITNNQDVDFSNEPVMGNERVYCNNNIEVDIKYRNSWTVDYNLSYPNGWYDSGIIDDFYIDLNLCGKKNEYNLIEDCGCPIKVKDRKVVLENFISGIITTFLNGRVFDESFAVNDLTTDRHKSKGNESVYVIGYQGFGKNIILPKYIESTDNTFVFIPTDKNYIYYDFMINNNDFSSKGYYEKHFKPITIKTDKNKYT